MPDPILQATALRYAAGDLTPEEVATFEARLAREQDARDALSEAVRLSARAIGQNPPTPHPSFRQAIRARLVMRSSRVHSFAWMGFGAVAIAACMLLLLSLADRDTVGATPMPPPVETTLEQHAVARMPDEPGVSVAVENLTPGACDDEPQQSVAEIWAELSNHENVEKARDDELRWRQRIRDLSHLQHVSEVVRSTEISDVRDP